jgi:hypothetical protein
MPSVGFSIGQRIKEFFSSSSATFNVLRLLQHQIDHQVIRQPVEIFSERPFRNRPRDFHVNIHFEERGPALRRRDPTGLHIQNVDAAVGEKPAHVEDNARMVYA